MFHADLKVRMAKLKAKEQALAPVVLNSKYIYMHALLGRRRAAPCKSGFCKI